MYIVVALSLCSPAPARGVADDVPVGLEALTIRQV